MSKRANANVIATIDDVKAVVERHKTQMPGKVEVFYSQDQAPFAEQQVTELQGNIFTALALVMVLVVAAMGFRSGLIVGLGIPVSFLFSLIFVYLRMPLPIYGTLWILFIVYVTKYMPYAQRYAANSMSVPPCPGACPCHTCAVCLGCSHCRGQGIPG